MHACTDGYNKEEWMALEGIHNEQLRLGSTSQCCFFVHRMRAEYMVCRRGLACMRGYKYIYICIYICYICYIYV